MPNDQAYYKSGFDKSVSDTHAWRTVSNAVPFVIPYLNKKGRLLDVGSGPGTISKDFANYVAEVVGVEPTQELVDLAASQPDLPKSVTFQYGSAYNLPFEDNSFDFVHASQVVVHLEKPIEALKEMERVCKPGGYVFVKDTDLKSKVIYPEKYASLLTNAVDSRIKNSSTSPIAGRQLKERALAAGYKVDKLKYSSSVWCISSYEERHEWAERFCSRLTKTKESNLEGEQLENVLRAYREWSEDESALMILIHGELVYRV
ncbi:hypothetical protein PGUG_03890 [Meyerozyma guilliermondii ATCC 6260]|uniref:Methyltransferase type 11 domain-containing protein n=1 Tax=Meyerozyma guilliermondii (strain ATCC 6260 / CBS 566 / DSM 6381 / JCM 1539 / NBRC 10279 / NRRL Y-324) TaxID=294746 RepID=A5DKT9_PICGU|nr:uncharacterized protein PGUG_03890 [Meyerozyma guilliermondii ATCC 6260]EDK39792.2 hypothetical protein PGUG_03890 [Meyerozyma guilliermondii ATCC 6260]